MTARVRLLAVALLCCLSRSVAGQTAVARGTVDGLVSDGELHPLANTTVWMLGTDLEVTTRENGRFRMLGVPAGEYVIVVRRIGYAPYSTVVQVAPGDTARLSFTLEQASVSLDTIRVTAAAPAFSPMLREFEDRRRRGLGKYLTAADIRKLNLGNLSSYLRLIPTVDVFKQKAYGMRSGCPMQWFVDDVLIPVPANVDRELPSPSEIYGIEVYTSAGTIPPKYATFGTGAGRDQAGGAFCGVIALWTKR